MILPEICLRQQNYECETILNNSVEDTRPYLSWRYFNAFGEVVFTFFGSFY